MKLYKLKQLSDAEVFALTLDHLSKTSQRICLVARDTLQLDHEGAIRAAIQLKPNKIKSTSWPGTELIGATGTIYSFDRVKELTKLLSSSFHDFTSLQYPNFFEDIHAYGVNGLLLYSIIHEEEVLILDRAENRRFLEETGKFWTHEDPTPTG